LSKVIRFDNNQSRVRSPVVVITGRADASVSSIEAGPDFNNLTRIQLKAGRFQAIMQLKSGRNQLVFQPYAPGGSPLQSESRVVYLETDPTESYQVQTSLDNHGQAIGFNRLPGERSVSYKNRLLQAAGSRDDQRTYVPVAISTEAAVPFSRDILRVKTARSAFNNTKLRSGFIKVTPTQFKYTGGQTLEYDGPFIFDKGYPYAAPTNEVSPFSVIKVYTENGDLVSKGDYEWDADLKRLHLKNPDYYGAPINIIYNKVLSFDLAGITLDDLKTAVESEGHLLFDITDTKYHNDQSPADWLVPIDWTSVPETQDYPVDLVLPQPGAYVSMSSVKTWVLHEHAKDLLVNGSGLGTKLEVYVDEVKKEDHRTWPLHIVGVHGLRSENISPLYDAIPNLMDSISGYWGQDRLNIHQLQYLGIGFKDSNYLYRGVKEHQWQSGTGQLGDLEGDTPVNELTDPADVILDPKPEPDGASIIYGII